MRRRLSLRDTGAALGLSRDIVARALAECGIARRHGPARPSKAALVRLYVRGRLSLRDVGEALGLGKDTVAARLARALTLDCA